MTVAEQRRWDVLRDTRGNPITITPDQCAAILHALHVYGEVVNAGGHGVFDSKAALAILRFMNAKSALMGRMLYDGRPPLNEPPPTTYMGAPAWHLYDPNLCRACGGEVGKPGRALGASVDQDDAPASLRRLQESTGLQRGRVRTQLVCIEPCHHEPPRRA